MSLRRRLGGALSGATQGIASGIGFQQGADQEEWLRRMRERAQLSPLTPPPALPQGPNPLEENLLRSLQRQNLFGSRLF
jgi:hypothetical protein